MLHNFHKFALSKNSEDVQLQGFNHSLSPIKTTQMKQAPCFDCLVQTSDSNKVYAVCYDPQQRKHLIQPKQKSLVKITVIVKRDWQISWRNSRHQSDIRRDKSQYCVGIKKAKSCVGCNDTFSGESKEMVSCFSYTTTMLFPECATKLLCNLAIKREKN